MLKKYLAALVLAGALGACATGTTNLTLTVPSPSAAVLSEAPPTRLDVTVADQRDRTDRIGDKRNGYNQVMGSIGTVQPPAETVEQALERVVTANNHVLGTDSDRYELRASLKRFWFDYRTGLVTVEFFGNVNAEVALVDRTTGATLYTESFEGYHSERTGGGLSQTWTRVMDAALVDLANKVGMSEGLQAAIAATHQPAEPDTNS
jgi:uncharacterized lipoprotein YajG